MRNLLFFINVLELYLGIIPPIIDEVSLVHKSTKVVNKVLVEVLHESLRLLLIWQTVGALSPGFNDPHTRLTIWRCAHRDPCMNRQVFLGLRS